MPVRFSLKEIVAEIDSAVAKNKKMKMLLSYCYQKSLIIEHMDADEKYYKIIFIKNGSV